MFDLGGKIALITGGCGLLGIKHAEAILEFGGEVILADVVASSERERIVNTLKTRYSKVRSVYMDVTDKASIQDAVDGYENIHILINNAALDPKVEKGFSWKNKFENLELDSWNKTINVTLNGVFLCSQVVINKMLFTKTEGVILNIASDLSVIAPDQRIYTDGPKPAAYGVAKAGVVNLTKYLATYFAKNNIRVNSLSPAGVSNNQVSEFVSRYSKLIPMNRMAMPDEFKGAVVFLCSDASSFMTGHNLIIDGGRTVW